VGKTIHMKSFLFMEFPDLSGITNKHQIAFTPKHQKGHHVTKSYLEELKKFLKEHGIEQDEIYLMQLFNHLAVSELRLSSSSHLIHGYSHSIPYELVL